MDLLVLYLFYIAIPILACLLLANAAISMATKRMTPLSIRIWGIGLAVIFILNLFGAFLLPFNRKGVQAPVNEEAVSVYPARDSVETSPIPIKEWVPGKQGPIDSGKRVQVYMRHSFSDKLTGLFPKITLFVFALTAFVSWLASIIAKYRNVAA